MIPTYSGFDKVYVDLEANKPRYDAIKALHNAKYGQPVDFLVRAPGRVNLIGDHIDYSFFSVLPMAISNDTIMAVTITDDPEVKIVNTDSKFPFSTFEIPSSGEVTIDANVLHWSNFFKGGFIIGSRYLLKQGKLTGLPVGMLVTMSGNVPEGAGLSSSAAFVVAATLTTLRANGITELSKSKLTELSITTEQLMGMNTGGMDQAASIFGENDHALFISFRPELSAVPVSFPTSSDPFVFLIANSLVTSIKYETAPIHYNLRVVESTLAAQVLAKILSLNIPQDGNLQAGTLRGVYEARFKSSEVTEEHLLEMANAVDEVLKKDGYTKTEVAAVLGISENDLEKRFLTQFPVRFEKLKLNQRAKHVYLEAWRVLEFQRILNSGTPDTYRLLGNLMNESHESAKLVYENSHPSVDELIDIARSAGSYGSRITGAGWGGCSVHLVPASKVATIKHALKTKYYDVQRPNAPADAMIDSVPASGVCLMTSDVLN